MVGGIVAVAVGVWLIRWHLRRTAARPGGHFCARCSVILGVNQKFCGQCGAPTVSVGVTCPSCGAPIGTSDRFCTRCGTPVGGTPPAPTP
ncbi:MAG: hypothetical protein KatS3mg061_0155 [Dehalococcoidia bacterium]|nr:MAG: hypothetical protein KatS3mg061_0155 [Dehalococcoidia bacterium]